MDYMCGRFTLRSDGNALAQHFEVEEAHAASPRYNIAPTQAVSVVRLNPSTGRREVVMLRWGLIPHWADRASPPPVLFNARSETVTSKPAFRDAFRERRCLIPADGYYEWKGTRPPRQPWFIHRSTDSLFAFAGLWEGETCTVLTTAPVPLLAGLHDRMPAIAPEPSYAAWLDPAPWDPTARLELLAAPADLEAYPVGMYVNRASHDAPDCLAAV